MDRSQLTLRRLRLSPTVRALVREVRVDPTQLMQPLFVVEGTREREAIPGLATTFRDTTDSVLQQIESDLERGVRAFLLFGVPARIAKREREFLAEFTSAQIAAIKRRFGEAAFLAVDVCACSLSTHGHCGVLHEHSVGGSSELQIDNAASVQELARIAGEYALAGADCVAPSDMMDGRIGAIRQELARVGREAAVVMSYSAKFASRFYGPFRHAADSAPRGNVPRDRSSYQIDPARPSDAIASTLRDLEEGADLVMVKPGVLYLDVIARLRDECLTRYPGRGLAAYEVSGEYAQTELLAREGLIDRAAGHVETWTALARAGAQIIISYGARHAREWLRESELSSHPGQHPGGTP